MLALILSAAARVRCNAFTMAIVCLGLRAVHPDPIREYFQIEAVCLQCGTQLGEPLMDLYVSYYNVGGWGVEFLTGLPCITLGIVWPASANNVGACR